MGLLIAKLAPGVHALSVRELTLGRALSSFLALTPALTTTEENAWVTPLVSSKKLGNFSYDLNRY